MKSRVLVKKYTEGLVNALKDDAEYRRVREDLEAFAGLMRPGEKLREALANPFLNARKRGAAVGEILERMSCHEKTKKLLGLLVEHGRLDILGDIAAAVPEAWNERQGVMTFTAVSAVPMTEAQKKRLTAELERLEKGRVTLVASVDPGIIGGLTLRRGNIVYDASVEGDLLRLMEKIQEG
jgi:F-type H+-transporting ATPase subunit delta